MFFQKFIFYTECTLGDCITMTCGFSTEDTVKATRLQTFSFYSDV